MWTKDKTQAQVEVSYYKIMCNKFLFELITCLLAERTTRKSRPINPLRTDLFCSCSNETQQAYNLMMPRKA